MKTYNKCKHNIPFDFYMEGKDSHTLCKKFLDNEEICKHLYELGAPVFFHPAVKIAEKCPNYNLSE